MRDLPIRTLNHTTAYRLELGDGLTLKSVGDPADVERLVVFNASVFGDGVGAMTRAFLLHHPTIRPDYWLYVEQGDQIVSALVLIPWEWRYGGSILKAGEMGIVGTSEALRGRGLVRALDVRFKELLQRDGFHLSHIQGIPYFYRQFGYEYALPLEAQWRIELRALDFTPDAALRFRTATPADIPLLMQFASAAEQPLDITAVRSRDVWDYLLTHAPATATAAETWLIEREVTPIGYCRIPHEGFGEGLIISEVSPLDIAASEGLLAWLKNIAQERGKPYLRFNLATSNRLLQVARSYGAYDAGGYQFQLYVPDAARLLAQITPVLEERVAKSVLAGISTTLPINLYRSGVALTFEKGRLRSVQPTPPAHDSMISIPPQLLASLVLGYRSRDELAPHAPDLRVWGRGQVWCDVLFSKMEAWIDTIY